MPYAFLDELNPVFFPKRQKESKRKNFSRLLGSSQSYMLQMPGAMPSAMQILEVTDLEDKTLMMMQAESVVRQKLYRRTVSIILYGGNGTIFIHKRSEAMIDGQGLWDLYSGPVRSGEAREDAAMRLLESKTGVKRLKVNLHRESFPFPGEPFHITIFSAKLPRGVVPDYSLHETMRVDQDELEGLIMETPELFSRSLLLASREGIIFSRDDDSM